MTQLEWLVDVAAQRIVDGVVLDAAHFPRVDGEYAAQVRKVAVDLGLDLVALDAPDLFDVALGDDAREALVALAASLGAPLLRTALPVPGPVPPERYAAVVREAKAVARTAKAANVTVAIEPRPATLGEDLAGVRRVIRDVDSAWLRFAAAAGDPLLTPRDRVVLTLRDLATGSPLGPVHGPLLFTGDGGDDPHAALRAAAGRVRSSTTEAVWVPA